MHVLLPLILASVVFDENLTFILLALSLWCNPGYYKAFSDDRLRIFFKWLLLLFAVVIMVVTANGILIVGTSVGLVFEQHHRLFVLLLLVPAIADFTHVSLSQTALDGIRIYRNFHIGLFVLVVVKLVYVIAMGGLSSGFSLEALLGRGSGFFSRNPNFSDDYAVILICASAWTTLLAARGTASHLLGIRWLAPLVVTLFFFNIIVFSESRAGWIGVATASVATAVMLGGFRHAKAAGLLLVLLALLGGLHWDKVVPEATKSWPAVKRLVINPWIGQPPETTAPNMENRSSSLAAAKSQRSGENPATSNCEDGSATLEDLAGSGKDLNITLRLAIYDFAFNAWLARPFLGYGAYDKRRLVKEIPAEDRCAVLFMDHPHNLYLHLGISGGLILLLPVVALACAPILLLGLAAWRKLPGALLYLPAAAFSVFFLAENLFGLNFTNLHLGVPIAWLLMTVVSFAVVQANTLDKRQLDL